MSQRKFTAEELATLNQVKNFFDLLGIPFNVKDLEKSDMQARCKTPSFEYSIQPGYILKFEDMGKKRFAIAITSNRLVHVDEFGKIKGYLVNPTMDAPYKVLEVRQPDSENFKLVDFDSMNLVWKRPVEKVKKSLTDIEQQLGMEPGTLEIF